MQLKILFYYLRIVGYILLLSTYNGSIIIEYYIYYMPLRVLFEHFTGRGNEMRNIEKFSCHSLCS